MRSGKSRRSLGPFPWAAGLTRRFGAVNSAVLVGGRILKIVNLSGVALAALSLGACVAPLGQRYPTPLAGTPTATITIAKSPYLSLGGDGVSFYSFDNDFCEDTDASGSLGGMDWTSANSISTEVRADTRIVIRVLTARVVGTGSGYSITNCTNLIALTPERGLTYTLRHLLFPQQEACVVEIIDDQNGGTPPSLERLPLVESCRVLVLRARED